MLLAVRHPSYHRYMGISAFGSDTVLRIQLRMRVRAIKSDDRDIMWEGVSDMSLRELQLACQERGMRSTGLSRDGYERQMKEWLQLRCAVRVRAHHPCVWPSTSPRLFVQRRGMDSACWDLPCPCV